MSEPLKNGATHIEEETEEPSDALNPSPPPSDTYEKVEDLLDKVESYNSVIPDAVTQSILETSGINNCSTDVRSYQQYQHKICLTMFNTSTSYILVDVSGYAPDFSGGSEVHL